MAATAACEVPRIEPAPQRQLAAQQWQRRILNSLSHEELPELCRCHGILSRHLSNLSEKEARLFQQPGYRDLAALLGCPIPLVVPKSRSDEGFLNHSACFSEDLREPSKHLGKCNSSSNGSRTPRLPCKVSPGDQAWEAIVVAGWRQFEFFSLSPKHPKEHLHVSESSS